MGSKNWGTVAGYARTVWKMGKCRNAVLSVAKSRNLEPNLKASAFRSQINKENLIGKFIT
jgi:hypothetical protein